MNNLKLDGLIHFILFIGTVLVIVNIIVQYRRIDVEWQFDLRGRIVGARVLHDGRNPYEYHYSKSMPDRFIDPLSSPLFTKSRVTVPPTVLVLHAGLAKLPYHQILQYWFIIQWLLFGMTILMVLTIPKQISSKKVILLVGLLFAASPIWYSNIIVGQIYILYDFFLALIIWSRHKMRYPHVVSGLLIGLLASFRPTYLLLVFTSAFYNRKLFISSIVGIVVSVGLTYFITGAKPWLAYVDSVRVISEAQLYEGGITLSDYYPTKIEELSLPQRLTDTIHDSSVKRFITLRTGETPSAKTLLLVLASILSVAIAFVVRKRYLKTFESYLLINLCLILAVEHLIPVGRYLYYNVQWLIPILILILLIDRYRETDDIGTSHLLVIGLTLFLVFFVPLFSISYSTVLLWLFALMMVFVSFRFAHDSTY